jgi:beta-lactamase superfamily II metal-dependent hydrolase
VRRPWLPASIREHFTDKTVTSLSYIAVDEILGNLVALAVSPWPAADGHGRLRFDHANDRGHIIVHRSELHDMLYDGWLRRDPRVGDVFAAQIGTDVEAHLAAGKDVALGPNLRLVDVLQEVVHDISADARRVAKLGYYAAMAPVVQYQQAEDHRQNEKADQRTVIAPPRQLRKRPWKGPFVPDTPSMAMGASPWQVPASLVKAAPAEEFLHEITTESTALIYFLLNVGDGDTQLLLLPVDNRTGRRRAVVVDVATTRKLTGLMQALQDKGILPDLTSTKDVFPVVVATHPHDDHIGGMPEFLDRFGRAGQISDFWEPGYYHPSAAFVEMMTLLEECTVIRTQPTSGMTRWTSGAKITVLAPSVGLRVRYDSYGVDVNDASIMLKVEFPVARVAEQLDQVHRNKNRHYLRLNSPWTLILGADAQNTSWAHVTADFPQLQRQYDTPLYRELAAARGRDYLSSQVFKVSHHASKHGINLELVERVHPDLALVSSVCGGGKYNFPHALATEAIREAMQRTTSKNSNRLQDHQLGIHYTGGTVPSRDGVRPLGSIAIVLSPTRGSKLRMWRFGDLPHQPVDLSHARRVSPVRSPR